MTYRIVITPSRDCNKAPRHNGRGTLYDVTYEGRVIVTDSTEPCLAACRALKAIGITGRLEMWDTVLPYVRLTADIDSAAKKTIREGDEPPRLVKNLPFAPRSAQDSDFASGGVPVAQTGKSRATEIPGGLGPNPDRAAGMKGKANKTGRSKGSLSHFVAIERYLMRSTAWRSLSPVARAVYSEVGFHYTGDNNGRIVISVRSIAASLGISKDTTGRALQVLEERGFIETVKRGAFNIKQRHASEFRLTAFRCDVTGALPSKKFMRWTHEIQNTVRPQGPNGTTTGTDGTKATRNYPSRSLPSDCQSVFQPTHGTTTGTHLESTIGGEHSVPTVKRGAGTLATMAVGTGRYRH